MHLIGCLFDIKSKRIDGLMDVLFFFFLELFSENKSREIKESD